MFFEFLYSRIFNACNSVCIFFGFFTLTVSSNVFSYFLHLQFLPIDSFIFIIAFWIVDLRIFNTCIPLILRSFSHWCTLDIKSCTQNRHNPRRILSQKIFMLIIKDLSVNRNNLYNTKKQIIPTRLTIRISLLKKHGIKRIGDCFYGYRQTRESSIGNIAIKNDFFRYKQS